MERATQSPAQMLSGVEPAQNDSGFFSSEYDVRRLREESDWTFQPENPEQLHAL